MSNAALSVAVANIGPQIQALVEKAAVEFKTNNGAAVNELGADLVDAIFATQAANYFPALPALAPDASVDAIAARSDLEATRTKMFAVIAQAESQHYATIHALKLSAAATVSNVVTSVLSIVGGLVLTAIAAGHTVAA